MLKIGLDIGGVVSKHPSQFRELCNLLKDSCEIFIITDMHDKDKILVMLKENGFGMIPPERVYSADYKNHGEMCKAILLRELGIDIFIDDFGGYVQWDSQLGAAPIRLLMAPDAF